MQDIVIGKDQVLIGELIGKGGEGEVYSIEGRSGQVVKIYNPKLRAQREGKVRAMISEGLASKTNLVAYPVEIVFDRRGNFLGFAMQFVKGYLPLHQLYSPKSRQRHFPKADYRFIVRAALNVARAVGKVHQTGCIIGDLNHSGVLVAQDATIVLIDADSFQFHVNGKSYPCVVGVQDFTPPELHGKNLATVERTSAHDNFCLAVALFHLLFMGRHPYAGQYTGHDISMGDAIAENRFAFSLIRQSATQTTPPPGTLTLDLFPSEIRNAFEGAFGLYAKARPSAADWIVALSSLEGHLNRCRNVKVHYYPSNAKTCVWCNLAGNSGFDMFPDLAVSTSYVQTDTIETERAIQEIMAFKFPEVSEFLPQPSIPPGASSALRQVKSTKAERIFKGVFVLIVAGLVLAGAPQLWLLSLVGGIWGLIQCLGSEIEHGPFQQAFKVADEGVQQALDSFIQRKGLIEFLKVRHDLDADIDAYRSHNALLERELMKFKSTRETRQRSAYLDQFPIRHANIPGIGPSKTAKLISFGIETAADINPFSIRRIKGFGEVMTDTLMAWRRNHEARFRYNRTQNAQDVADEALLRSRFANEKAKLESNIRNGLSTLRKAKPRLHSLATDAGYDLALSQALEIRAQAEQDLKAIGAAVPDSLVGLTVASATSSVSQHSQVNAASTSSFPHHVKNNSMGVPSCPNCGATMRRRSGQYGQFWGCSSYPQCRGTRSI